MFVTVEDKVGCHAANDKITFAKHMVKSSRFDSWKRPNKFYEDVTVYVLDFLVKATQSNKKYFVSTRKLKIYENLVSFSLQFNGQMI